MDWAAAARVVVYIFLPEAIAQSLGTPGLSADDWNAASIGASAGASSCLPPLSLPPQSPPLVAPGPTLEGSPAEILPEVTAQLLGTPGLNPGNLNADDLTSSFLGVLSNEALSNASECELSRLESVEPFLNGSGGGGGGSGGGGGGADGDGDGDGGGGDGGSSGGGGGSEGSLAPTNPAAPSDAGTEGTLVLAGPTVTVAEGSFVQQLLEWTREYHLAELAANKFAALGCFTCDNLRELLNKDWDEVTDYTQFLQILELPPSSAPPPLTPWTMKELIRLVKAVQDKAAERRDPVECFVEEVLRMGVNNLRAEAEKQLLEKHLESLKVEGADRIGFTIKLDGDMYRRTRRRRMTCVQGWRRHSDCCCLVWRFSPSRWAASSSRASGPREEHGGFPPQCARHSPTQRSSWPATLCSSRTARPA